MKLSDWTIRHLVREGGIEIDPMPEDVAFQPVSVDLTLGTSYVLPRAGYDGKDHSYVSNETSLNPGAFLLATTRERIRLGVSVVGQIVGKSTLARHGLIVESAGLIDPGFNGTITLELANLSSLPIPLRAGMQICQVVFDFTDRPVDRKYGHPELRNHYQGQEKATPAAKL